MAIDDDVVIAEQSVVREVKVVVGQQTGSTKLVLLLVAIIVGALVIWWVGSSTLGFMTTNLGFMLIGITLVAVIMWLWMRSKGIGFQSWTGGIIEVMLITMLLVVYVGALDALSSLFLSVFPILLLGLVGYAGYRWWQYEKRENVKKGILALVITFIIAFPVYNALIVPYTTGTPMEMEIVVSRDSHGAWNVYGEIHPMSFTNTMSTQLNPYAIAMVETSGWMWTSIDTTEKAYLYITISDDSKNEVVYSEIRHPVYVGNEDSESVWGIFHLPPEDARHYVPYRMLIQLKDDGGVVLSAWSYIYRTN